MTEEIVYAILQIFGTFFVGWLARRLGYICEEELNRWSRFVVDFLLPLLVFHSVLRGFEPARLPELWPLPVVGLGMILVGALAGLLLRRALTGCSADLIKTFHHFCAVNNYGFLPIIIVQNTMGADKLALLFFFNLGSSIGYWTVGVGILGGVEARSALRNLLSPNLVALFLALALRFTGVDAHLPRVVVNISGSVGAAAVPCILILIGAALYPVPRFLRPGILAYLTMARLFLLPAFFVFVLKALPLAADVRQIAMIVALMPASVSSTIITRRFGGDPDFAARAAILTTLLSILTVPLGLWLVG